MKEPPLRPGTLVRSLAGRDMGSCYVVIRTKTDPFVAVANGGIRSVERPKTKNRKHLIVIGSVDEPLRSSLERGERVSNGSIEDALQIISHI